MLITGIIFWILVRPQSETLGFTYFPQSKSKYIYLAVFLLLVMMAGYNLFLDPSQVMPTILSCLVFPLFEEPLFRGWIWNWINPTLPSRGNGWLSVLITTVLFAIWHLGYWDVVALHVRAGTTLSAMMHIMLMKMVIASIIGLAAGLLRWKTGNSYASILFHMFWNLLGR
jgi:membrane protease YdiL (CAAX protease family)